MDVLVVNESYVSTSMAVAHQQGSCAAYMSGHACASANPAIDIESSSAYVLATPSSSRASTVRAAGEGNDRMRVMTPPAAFPARLPSSNPI